MKLTARTLCAILSVFVFASCQKEVTNNEVKSSIQGTYKFVSAELHSNVSNEVNDGTEVDKAVSITDYITKNNSGTFVINANTITCDKVSYSIDTTVKVYSYTNGALNDSEEMPFQFDMPSASSVVNYKMITSDSIYLTSGLAFFNSTQASTTPSGVKLRVSGNMLYMDMYQASSSSQVQQGLNVRTVMSAKTTIALQKQ